MENYKWPKLHDLPVVKMASFVLGMGKSSNMFFWKVFGFVHTHDFRPFCLLSFAIYDYSLLLV